MMKKFIKIFIKYPVEGIFINFIYLFFKILPIDFSSSIGSFIAKLIGPILSVNKVIRNNLEKAFPDKDNNWYDKINNEVWSNFGRVTAEYSHFSKLASSKNERITIIDNEHSRDFFDTSVKKILVSSHNANWEIMGIACRKNSDKISGIVRQPNNPYAKKIINNLRNKFSVTCYEKNMIGTKNIINDFNNGNSLALLSDLRLTTGLESNFFNIKSKTTSLPAQLGLKNKCKIYLAWVKRKNKSNFEVEFFNPLNTNIQNNTEKNIQEITNEINYFFQKKITEDPGQYFWLHDRWK